MIAALHYIADVRANCLDGESCSTGLPSTPATADNVQIILQLVFGVAAALAILFVLLAALRFITAQGDPQKVIKARQGIIFAALGLAIALSAEVIVTFVLKRL